jgi:hypothetical protein
LRRLRRVTAKFTSMIQLSVLAAVHGGSRGVVSGAGVNGA